MDQSLREQNEKSTIQILNSSADEALKSFCGQYNSTARESSSPEPQALSAPSEGPTTESVETTTNQELFPT